MSKNLVIVESPAKAKTIEKYLGKDFTVRSCNGHVRDLSPKELSIDIENNFEPQYQVLKEKEKIIKELRSEMKKSETIWLATDEDREGEAISWHLAEILKLDEKNTKRIVFHEITKNAILDAIASPRFINKDLVSAQQARRVLDRLVGFKISPILWKKVKPALSAGRVQSVALRLIVDREREIMNFKPNSFFRVTGLFQPLDSKKNIKAELSKKFGKKEEALAFMNNCMDATFSIDKVEKKSSKRNPAPPFTTSTLQQEASRKLGYSVSQTMRLAQSLYEAGHITYMRTDSVRLSNIALASAKEQVITKFGERYSKTRNFATKSKSAQEAHEAIRPTNLSVDALNIDPKEARLYELIWKRTIASQMSPAEIEKTQVKIQISNNPNHFNASGEVIKFDGFLKLYIESTDDENGEEERTLLPPVKQGDTLNRKTITATQRFTRPPARYTEASLVKKMEELGIGRPSTYAPTISTIQKREYVIKDYRDGQKRGYDVIQLENNHLEELEKSEIFGAEKGKLFPCSIGMIVNDFLVDHFEDIIDYNFTAEVENKFDNIAEGKNEWQKMISTFYHDQFQPVLNKTLKEATKKTGERYLGIDPKTKHKVFVKLGKYGPFVQLGDKEEVDKPKFAKLKKGQLIESISLEEALGLLEMPRELGTFEGHPVMVNIGRFGPYVDLNKYFVSIPKDEDPYTIELDRAIELIKKKREADANKTINVFDHKGNEIKILRGRWGPYISYQKKSFKIPKGTDAESIDVEKALELIEEAKNTKTKRKSTRGRKKK